MAGKSFMIKFLEDTSLTTTLVSKLTLIIFETLLDFVGQKASQVLCKVNGLF